MSAGQIATNRIALVGLVGGLVVGLIFFWLAEQFPNVGVLFLSSALPVYLSWKIPIPVPLWTWFVAYYSIVGSVISWLASHERPSKKCLVFLSTLLAVHYLATFLIAGEIAKIFQHMHR